MCGVVLAMIHLFTALEITVHESHHGASLYIPGAARSTSLLRHRHSHHRHRSR